MGQSDDIRYGQRLAKAECAAEIAMAVALERERCARIAETEEEADGDPSQEQLEAMIEAGPVLNARAAIRSTKKSIAARIRAVKNGDRT